MPFSEWTQELSVGVEEMDAEHRRWLGILNELFDALNAGADQDVMRSIIDHMLTYSITHLTHEEQYMLSIKYPLFESHREKHNSLIGKIERLRNRAEDKVNFKLTIETLNLLKTWLSNHIMITDRKYGEYVASLNRTDAE